MAVYGYTRVSTDKQAEEGESLGTQERKIKGYAMQHELDVEQIFVEKGVSGSVPLQERPVGGQLLIKLQKGDVVITPKLDRMFRSAVDALKVLDELKKRGVSLHMIDLGGDVTGDGISKLVFTILSAVSEAERDRIRERIRDVKSDQKKRNRFLGGTLPFGFVRTKDGSLREHKQEQQAIRRMVRMQKSGKPLRAIADKMTAEGFPVSHAGVKKIITAAEARSSHAKRRSAKR